ncbi:PAS domain-containing protein [Psychrosphaera sp.]|nr:PAS domain-containing protein [Psychrosphaera sp.]
MESNNLDTFFFNDYMPHGHCYLWQPHILWTNVIADLVIAIAYFSIPIALVLVVHKRPDIGYRKVMLLFSMFILCCGITHLFSIVTIWQGMYGWHGILKVITAIVSFATAIYLYRVVPALINITTPQQIEGIKQEFNDVSKQKNQLSIQIEQQKLVQFMIDSMPIGACLLDKKFDVIMFNEAFCSDTKITQKHLGEANIKELLDLDDVTSSEFINSISTKSDVHNIESKTVLRFKKVNDDSFPAEVTLVTKVFDGAPYYIFTLQNLSEIEDVKRQLLESNQKLHRAIDAAEDGVWEYNVAADSINWSEQFEQLIAANGKATSIETWKAHIHKDYVEPVIEAFKNGLKNKERFSVEYLGLNANREFGWFNLIGKTFFNDAGQAKTMSGSLRYIQDSKALKLQVAEKKELLNAIYEGANNSIWIVSVEKNQQFRFLLFNRTASEKLGSEPDSFAGKRVSEIPPDILNEAIAEKLVDNLQACVDVKKVIEYTEMIPEKGIPRWYHTSLYPIIDNERVIKVVASSIEITSQKVVERQLSENKLFLENIIDSSICGISLFDLSTQKVVKINQRYTDILGYSLEDIHNIRDRLSLYHPDDLQSLSAHLELVIQAPNNSSHSIQYRYRHKNGTWKWCRTYTSIIKRDENNNPLIMLTTFIDISEQIQLLDSLQESNSYLERFAMVASHDLQEPLRKILTFTDMLSETLANNYDLDSDSKYQFERIKDASSRMRVMIADILGLSQINNYSMHKTEFELKELVLIASDQLQIAIEESNAEIKVINGEVKLNADKSLFIQLLQNLIGNALKFRSHVKPVVEIKAEITEYSTIISIKDNGIGMEEKYFTQIFEPFKRLHSKDRYQGSGIGLAICKQVCKIHDGGIECSSKLGVGTTFKVTLPR